MATDATGRNRIITMGRKETVDIRLVARGAEDLCLFTQQHKVIGHVYIVTSDTTLQQRSMHIGLVEFLTIMASET